MTEQTEQKSTGGGNTGSPPPLSHSKQPAGYNYWCFTLNNPGNDGSTLAQILISECRWYIFQEEKGEEGTLHLQGILCLLKRQRITSLKRLHPKIHWEPTRNIKASVAYCTKEATRCGEQWVHGIKPQARSEAKRLREQIIEPQGWQLQVVDIIKQEPDDRTIYWFWEPDGRIGKSKLCKYIGYHHGGLLLSGKATDMFHIIADNEGNRDVILIDIPRRALGYVNYTAIESIKNGYICSGKYKSKPIMWPYPHVIVFANEEPDYTAMSKDRWNVVRIQR